MIDASTNIDDIITKKLQLILYIRLPRILQR